ncbi:6-phospho-beta-glucosidase [Phytohabitans sp. ZYX-F-186]|uniref:6-phospho-beta-glucosidase n=1 Tax=Phytohabitans maris TaxID=3071409 RepID=A0ABU0ZAJ3_9ACTN|nr:6-phospho-beta-glucosidase [Phytohabitans sp. ZYX-F-186]MDQ7903998.1 6-phospho-beta-glucosidase [Phytohabitans sp. ZYX-F-186]
MRLTILGGGGFRVPLVYRALLADRRPGRVTDVVLHDVAADRLAAIRRVLAEQAAGIPDPPRVTATTDLDEAVRGTDFVFSAMRVGGMAGRAADERIALDEGVLGQETVGAGGVSYALRTLPVARHVARRVAALAPGAWVVNFTNPAGTVTEAMAAHLGDRVIGICDSPVGLGRRVARALRLDPAAVRFDYAGLNHLGWLRGVHASGTDHLPRLLADREALASFEEGRLFGAGWLRALGAVPNEYLHHYYYTREAVAAARTGGRTRGALLLEQQRRFYAAAAGPGSALAAWEDARLERERTYGAEGRAATGAGPRDAADLDGGGYEQVALALMRAIAHDEPATLVLNVRNRGTLGILDAEAVVEVPCAVDATGARPLPADPLPEHAAGLVCAVKAVERAAIEAAVTGSRSAALKAIALHPLVDSVTVARRLLDAYTRHHPQLSYLSPRRAP